MKKRTLPSKKIEYGGGTVPPLVSCYVNAVRGVCATKVYVNPTMYPRFEVLQNRLLQTGISLDRYAFTVVKTWWEWCRSKNMRIVPPKIFYGKAAWGRFMGMQKSTVVMQTEAEGSWHRDVHQELTAALAYIGAAVRGRAFSLSQARKAVGSSGAPSVVKEAMDTLNLMYDMHCNTYLEIVYELADREHIPDILDTALS